MVEIGHKLFYIYTYMYHYENKIGQNISENSV